MSHTLDGTTFPTNRSPLSLGIWDYTRGWSTLSGPSMATLLKTTGQTCSIILCFTIFAMSKAFDFIFRQHPALGICLRWGLFMKHEFYTTVTLVLADATSAVSKSMKIRDWLCESDWDPSMRAWIPNPTRPSSSPSQHYPVLLRCLAMQKRLLTWPWALTAAVDEFHRLVDVSQSCFRACVAWKYHWDFKIPLNIGFMDEWIWCVSILEATLSQEINWMLNAVCI